MSGQLLMPLLRDRGPRQARDGFGARLFVIILQFYSKVYALSLKHPLAPAH